MQCSLIITTYNWPEALELVLLSILKQVIMPNEVIIADDGSDNNTKELIIKYQQIFTIPLIHSWQEDRGFRAARSRNKAIKKSNYEYIVMIDGDMILHKNFIKDHLKSAKKNYFIQGSRVLIKKNKTNNIFNSKNIEVNFFTKGIKNRKNTINNKLLSFIFSTINSSLKGIRSANISFWRNDLIKINGFNEDFIGWGREDSEIVARFYNIGIKRLNIKFNCNAYHLYHHERSRKFLEKNDNILANTTLNKIIRCENGID